MRAVPFKIVGGGRDKLWGEGSKGFMGLAREFHGSFIPPTPLRFFLDTPFPTEFTLNYTEKPLKLTPSRD